MQKYFYLFICLFPIFISSNVKADLSGSVFEDANFNGLLDLGESGVSGVPINLTDAQGTSLSTNTDASGNYSFPSAGLQAPLRIEAGSPADASFKVGLAGATTVVFETNLNASQLNIAFANSTKFCTADSESLNLIVPRITSGPISGKWKDDPAVVSFPFFSAGAPEYELYSAPATSDYTGPANSIVKHSAIGTVYGNAYEAQSKRSFFSAFMRRGAGFGGAGSGAIYVVQNGVSGLYVDLNAVFGAGTFGTDIHDFSGNDLDFLNYDKVSIPFVHKMGIGDLDISEDGGTLYAVNLLDKNLYLIPTHGLLNKDTIKRLKIPAPVGCEQEFRPFALGIHKNSVYVGGLCNTPATADTITGPTYSREDIRGYVYVLKNGTFETSPVLTFSLLGSWMDAHPWLDIIPTNVQEALSLVGRPTFTDIEFDGQDMVIFTRDRGADQYMSATHIITRAGEPYRACFNTNTSLWDFEKDGSCGGVVGAGKVNANKYYQAFPARDQRAYGSGVVISGLDLAVLANDPYWPWSGGMQWLSSSGNQDRVYEVFHTYSGVEEGLGLEGKRFNGSFQKLNGLGDVEAICDAPPFEIGNRVWFDENRDGIQDAAELGIAGVQLQLLDKSNGTVIGEALTDANGLYTFGGSGNKNLNPGVLLKLFADYQIRMQLSQNSLGGKLATASFKGQKVTLDSNALNNIEAGYASVEVSTSGLGESNHTYDIGLVLPVLIGDYVWFDADKDGFQDAGEQPLAKVTVSLLDLGVNQVIAMTTTDTKGHYYFTPSEGLLPLGKYHIILNNPLDSAQGGPLSGLTLTLKDAIPDNATDSDAAVLGSIPTIYAVAPNTGADLTFDFGFVIKTQQTPTPTPTPEITDLTQIQFAMDGSASALFNKTLNAMSQRKRAVKPGVCKAISSKAIAKLRAAATDSYNAAWEITWTKLPSKIIPLDQVNLSASCAPIQASSIIQSFVSEVSNLTAIGQSVLKNCRKSKSPDKSARKAFKRILKARSDILSAQTAANTSATVYPVSFGVCK